MNDKNDALNSVTRQVEEVKLLMADNIDKVLERSENIESVADKSHALRNYSQTFSVQARTIRQNARNKMWMIVCGGFALLIFVIIIMLLIVT